ncbi:MAG: SurA N-terminal domain-containing protein [Acidobacteriia bacterium]|nr:SurA N-terminal domain-containing protein [Terriglobia bacterium]
MVALPSARAGQGDVLDRVVVTIGETAITQSDVEQEYLFERFLDGQWPAPPPDTAALEQARDRLTYQRLLQIEGETTRAGLADPEGSAAERLQELRTRYGQGDRFESALRELGIDEHQLLDRLAEQAQILRIIDQRLRPAAPPTPAEIENYYRQVFLPSYAQRSKDPAPALSEVEGQIREILVQKSIDELLTKWLHNLEASHRVKFHSF